jgi:hypothetical protein
LRSSSRIEENLPPVTPCGKVRGDVSQDVDADEIGEAEGSGARPADGRTGERVNLFNRQSLL